MLDGYRDGPSEDAISDLRFSPTT
ncbi:BnaC01g36530D [Brassica napus]|uniref:BnaC01g36530D protein n=1 Tax=Brassica napus TaxID=3708 RepID=A0A078H4K5_BRANA|nr:BnaC01g36530D [Brassica napus]